MEKESLKISFIQIAINVPTAITKLHFTQTTMTQNKYYSNCN